MNKCECCKKEEAVVPVKIILGNNPLEVILCASCAKKVVEAVMKVLEPSDN